LLVAPCIKTLTRARIGRASTLYVGGNEVLLEPVQAPDASAFGTK